MHRETEVKPFDYNLYFVALFDLLGQRARLNDWQCHPRTAQEFKRAFQAIQDTAVRVAAYRTALQNWIDESSRLYKESLQRFPAETHSNILSELSTHVRLQQFSDTFMLIAPVLAPRGDGSSRILYSQIEHIFLMCSYQILYSLASECPLRGGIAVGTGVWIDEQWFYGPVLAEAYQLENQVAKGPRFVISDSVINLLEEGTKIFQASRELVDILHIPHIKRYLAKDDDGCWILDFLGEQIHLMLPGFTETVEKAHEFAESCSLKFRNCEKLGPRYARLHEYFKQNVSLWEFK